MNCNCVINSGNISISGVRGSTIWIGGQNVFPQPEEPAAGQTALQRADGTGRPANKPVRRLVLPDFKIGVTFSGAYRDTIVLPFCEELLNLGYTRDDIFYDEWHEAIISGVGSDTILQKIYTEHCECVVVLLSKDYQEKNWTGNIEWRAVRDLISTGDGIKICLLKTGQLDWNEINGLFQYQDIAKPIDGMTAKDVAEFINEKYKFICGQTGR